MDKSALIGFKKDQWALRKRQRIRKQNNAAILDTYKMKNPWNRFPRTRIKLLFCSTHDCHCWPNEQHQSFLEVWETLLNVSGCCFVGDILSSGPWDTLYVGHNAINLPAQCHSQIAIQVLGVESSYKAGVCATPSQYYSLAITQS